MIGLSLITITEFSPVDFKDLLIFKTIYETHGLNQTAKILGHTQSNITAHLKKIEYELKTILFIRGYDGVTPTPAAEQFYEFVSMVLKQFATLKQSLTNQYTKLLISELLFRYIVIENNQFSLDSNQFTIKRTDEMSQQLEQNYYDYVISFNYLNHKDYQLIEEHHLPTCFLQGQSVKLPNQLPILINNDISCPLRALTLKLYGSTTNFITVDSLNNLLQLVKTNRGCALLPTFLINEDLKTVDSKIHHIDYYIFQHKF